MVESTSGSHPEHVLGFFDEPSRVADVVSFLAEALRVGAPAVAVASARNLTAIRNGVRDTWPGLPVERLICLDAEATLRAFMVAGMPDGKRFRPLLGGLLERAAAAAAGRHGRFYTEMASLLWAREGLPAVLSLEGLLGDKARTYHYTVLCGYSDTTFSPEDDSAALDLVCEGHTRVLPGEVFEDLARRAGLSDRRGEEGSGLDVTPAAWQSAIDELDRLIEERLAKGDLITRQAHDEEVGDWAARLQRVQESLGRLTAANEGLEQRLRQAQGQVRDLRDANRELKGQLVRHDAS